jgi:MFS family permease
MAASASVGAMTEIVADRSYRALFEVPAIARLLLGMAVARIASAMLAIALVLFTLGHYHSPALAGAVAFASTFPGVLVSPIAGALLDRHGRGRLVLIDFVVAAASCVAIGGLAAIDQLPPALLVLLAVATGLTNPLSHAGLRSLLPLLVPKRLWERANAVDSNGYVLATLVGPPVAGTLVAVAGGPAAIMLVGGVFAVAAAVLLRIPEPQTTTASTGNLLIDAWQGLRYVITHPTLRALGLSISMVNAALGVLQIVIPVLLLERLGQGPAVVGLVWAAMGVAGLVAAIAFGRIDSRYREKRLIVWPMLAIAGAVTLLLVPGGLPVVVVALALFGLFSGPLDIGLFTIRQRRTDPAWMGRAFAISMSVNNVGFPIGSAITGLLVGWSLEGAILFGVGVCFLGAVIGQLLIPATQEPPVAPVPAPPGTPVATS